MRCFRPLNRNAITACDQKEALADRRGIAIAPAHFAMLDLVTMPLKLANETFEGLSFLCRIWLRVAVDIDQQRAPCFELFHIFEHDHPGLALRCPAQRYPGQAADLLLDRLAAAYNATINSFVLIECTGGALQVAPAVQPSQAPQFSQLPGVVGTMRNGKMSVTAASASATFTADEIIVESALGGLPNRLASYSQVINLATTGAGGMDTGTAPVSGFVALYAIYKPSTATVSILACNAATLQGNVYGGANMPAEYTASGLIAVVATNGSSQFLPVLVQDRKVSFPFVQGFTTSTGTPNLTSVSIASAVPLNAKSIQGLVSMTQTGTGAMTAGLAANAITTSNGFGYEGFQWAGANSTDTRPFGPIDLLTAQTIFFSSTSTAASAAIYIDVSSYTF
jgi:hypothetical protein